MQALPRRFSILFLALAPACAHSKGGLNPREQAWIAENRGDLIERLDRERRAWLQPHRTAPPNVSFAPQTRERGDLRVTVRPLLAEDQPWNLWPDGEARLFNDTAGYLYQVDIASPSPVRWVEEATELAVNTTDRTFPAASGPETLLTDLARLAGMMRLLDADEDLTLRLEHADAFRDAYLSPLPIAGERSGVLVFPAPTVSIHAVAMQLTLGLQATGGPVERLTFLFE